MFRLKAQHDGTSHSEGVLQSKTTEESTTESKIKGLDYSHSKDMTKNIRCFANAQHDVLNILRFLDISLTQDVSAMPQHDVCFLSQYDVDVSGLSPQHDTKDQDMRTSHSEGVLQSKTTEESNQTQSEV